MRERTTESGASSEFFFFLSVCFLRLHQPKGDKKGSSSAGALTPSRKGEGPARLEETRVISYITMRRRAEYVASGEEAGLTVCRIARGIMHGIEYFTTTTILYCTTTGYFSFR